jgi:hypothetical protein
MKKRAFAVSVALVMILLTASIAKAEVMEYLGTSADAQIELTGWHQTVSTKRKTWEPRCLSKATQLDGGHFNFDLKLDMKKCPAGGQVWFNTFRDANGVEAGRLVDIFVVVPDQNKKGCEKGKEAECPQFEHYRFTAGTAPVTQTAPPAEPAPTTTPAPPATAPRANITTEPVVIDPNPAPPSHQPAAAPVAKAPEVAPAAPQPSELVTNIPTTPPSQAPEPSCKTPVLPPSSSVEDKGLRQTVLAKAIDDLRSVGKLDEFLVKVVSGKESVINVFLQASFDGSGAFAETSSWEPGTTFAPSPDNRNTFVFTGDEFLNVYYPKEADRISGQNFVSVEYDWVTVSGSSAVKTTKVDRKSGPLMGIEILDGDRMALNVSKDMKVDLCADNVLFKPIKNHTAEVATLNAWKARVCGVTPATESKK